MLGTQPELRAALGNPFAPADAKTQLINTLLADIKADAPNAKVVFAKSSCASSSLTWLWA